jgi:hypothetical protein
MVSCGRAGAGQLRPGARAKRCADIQAVAAGDAAGRMDNDVLADLRAFAIQVLLHP